MGPIYLVSCVSKKQQCRVPAKDMYQSAWFQKARAFVESQHASWWILSAEYGLLPPSRVIAPYIKTMNKMSVHERKKWGMRVIEQMEKSLPRSEEIVVLAGMQYWEFIFDYLRGRALDVRVPLDGMGIGEQLHWLGNAAKG